MQTEGKPEAPARRLPWRGLGAWNLYFLAKLGLLWAGVLNFHPLPNIAFAAGLLLPLPGKWLPRLRQAVAIPIGAGLFYYDTWLPPIGRLAEAMHDIAGLSSDYLMEFAARTVDWNMAAAALALWVAYLFLSQWLRLSVFTVLALAYIALPDMPVYVDTGNVAQAAATGPRPLPAAPAPSVRASPEPVPVAASADLLDQSAPPTDENLNAYLQAFYRQQEKRQTDFPGDVQNMDAFDILVLNICSLSWSDLDAVQLRDHPLFGKMDIIFKNFNSATSYSGPASLRLLRASCGQTSHASLYQEPSAHCYLFENLKALGYTVDLALNHTGDYQGFLEAVRGQGQMPPPAGDQDALPRALVAFDGSPIRRDIDVLTQWRQIREKTGASRAAMFYNTVTLHDGNRYIKPDGGTLRADYRSRAQMLLDELASFVGLLEREGRPTLLMLVPEHGAALHGDRIQISGLREIPSPDITHVPVAIKLIGAKTRPHKDPVYISQSSSYLALSELVARLLRERAFSTEGLDLETLAAGLPQTAEVSENQAAIVMRYRDRPYIRLADSGWQPYPQ